MFSPGVRFLITNAPAIIPLSVLLYFGSDFLYNKTGGAFPRWGIVPLAIVVVPYLGVLRLEWNLFKYRRTAASMGAVIPPLIPDKWPFHLNTLAVMLKSFLHGYPGDNMWEWVAKLGYTYRVRTGSDERMVTIEPHYVKSILATNFDCWDKGPVFIHQMHSVLGTGVFNADGDMWKFHRSMTRPFFSKERITDFENFDRHATAAIALAKDRLRAGFPIDFQDLVSRFTLDSATEFLFDTDVHSLSAGLPYPSNTPRAAKFNNEAHPANQFATSFAQAQIEIAKRTFFGTLWPLVEIFGDNTKAHMKVIGKFIDPILADALRKKKDTKGVEAAAGGTGKVSETETFLEHMVNFTDDITVLRDEILNIMIAGRDTTASLLSFGFYMLSQHPDILQRLRSEIVETVGLTKAPTYDELRNMKYLRAFLNETLRLYPPVPFDVRSANKPTTLPSLPGEEPIYIPTGTKAIYSVFMMHRRTDLWGPDALEFDPNRFVDARVRKYLTPNPFIFVPFNAGPRICLGQQFAYNEASFMIVRLLQNFSSVSLAREAQPPKTIPPESWADVPGRQSIEKVRPGTHLTMFVDGGLWVRLGEAKEAKATT